MQATDGTHLFLLLWRAYEAVREHARRDVEGAGLGLSDFAVLEALLHKGPLAVNTIGPKVRLTSGAITTAVDRLVRRGLVERRMGVDRRSRMVHLTASGRKFIAARFAEHRRVLDRACSGLSETERARAIPLLRKLGKTAGAMLQIEK